MTTPAWSVNQLAATTVTRHALNPGDCQQILEMCGLVPEGLEVIRRSDVLPDDHRSYDIDESGPEKGNTINLGRRPRQQRRRRTAQGAA